MVLAGSSICAGAASGPTSYSAYRHALSREAFFDRLRFHIASDASMRGSRKSWHARNESKMSGLVARPERFERPTPRFVVWCSIQLSYGRICRLAFRAIKARSCRVLSEYIFCRSRRRAIATGSGLAWQAP